MRKPITCIIIDDEPLAQVILRKYIDKLEHLKLLGVCQNAFEALEVIHNVNPDILFLDICMPEISGIQMLKMLTTYRPYVIFVTGYPNYAAESYDFEATDYLLKPVSFERFVRSVSKVSENMEFRNSIFSFEHKGKVSMKIDHVRDSSFMVRSDKKLIKVNIEEIIFIEGLGDYLKFHLAQSMVIVRMTIRKIEQILKEYQFLQVNKSVIVNVKEIKTVDGNEVELSNRKKISIGGTFRREVLNNLEGRVI